MEKVEMKIGIYPGSFDPITIGHYDVIQRAAKIVDKLIIGVLDNHSKNTLFSPQERVELIKMVTKDIPNVEVDSFAGLLVDYAEQKKADVIIRGLRAITDFEYELQMAQTNYKMNPRVDTIFLTTSVEYSFLSSSVVKQVGEFMGPIEKFVPDCIVNMIKDKFGQKG